SRETSVKSTPAWRSPRAASSETRNVLFGRAVPGECRTRNPQARAWSWSETRITTFIFLSSQPHPPSYSTWRSEDSPVEFPLRIRRESTTISGGEFRDGFGKERHCHAQTNVDGSGGRRAGSVVCGGGRKGGRSSPSGSGKFARDLGTRLGRARREGRHQGDEA